MAQLVAMTEVAACVQAVVSGRVESKRLNTPRTFLGFIPQMRGGQVIAAVVQDTNSPNYPFYCQFDDAGAFAHLMALPFADKLVFYAVPNTSPTWG